jgi:hypothetical protein
MAASSGGQSGWEPRVPRGVESIPPKVLRGRSRRAPPPADVFA